MDTTHDRPLVNMCSRCWGWIAAWLAVPGLATLLVAGPRRHRRPVAPRHRHPALVLQQPARLRGRDRRGARDGKRVMVYFGQDGCPYCKALMKTNFAAGRSPTRPASTSSPSRSTSGATASDWIDGPRCGESAGAEVRRAVHAHAAVFRDRGPLVLRLNGYLPPERFTHLLDYVIQRRDRDVSLAEYLSAH